MRNRPSSVRYAATASLRSSDQSYVSCSTWPSTSDARCLPWNPTTMRFSDMGVPRRREGECAGSSSGSADPARLVVRYGLDSSRRVSATDRRLDITSRGPQLVRTDEQHDATDDREG